MSQTRKTAGARQKGSVSDKKDSRSATERQRFRRLATLRGKCSCSAPPSDCCACACGWGATTGPYFTIAIIILAQFGEGFTGSGIWCRSLVKHPLALPFRAVGVGD